MLVHFYQADKKPQDFKVENMFAATEFPWGFYNRKLLYFFISYAGKTWFEFYHTSDTWTKSGHNYGISCTL